MVMSSKPAMAASFFALCRLIKFRCGPNFCRGAVENVKERQPTAPVCCSASFHGFAENVGPIAACRHSTPDSKSARTRLEGGHLLLRRAVEEYFLS